jgi:peptide/nickel transport system permease protein
VSAIDAEVLEPVRPWAAAARRAAGGARRRPSPAVAIALAVLGALAVAAAIPGAFGLPDPNGVHLDAAFAAPDGAHPFGTDRLGRDVLARVVHGARTSLLIGLGATGIALAAGALIGVLAGFGHRLLDGALMRGLDVLASIPELLLALVTIVVLGTGAANVAAAVGIANIPAFARLVRSQVLVVRRAEFVDAARTLGRHPAWTAARHVLPNSLGPVLALAAITAGTAVLAGAGLSYLGFGPGPPSPEWGSMLVDGQRFLREAPWVVAFPGLAIVAVVVSAGILGRALRRTAS